ncbi:MAG: nucleotidyl transferase AbiEii/AbiGii toxin family protein [Polyangiales bacterium]
MSPIYAAALEIERACAAEGFAFCFIGGLAVQRWGEPRMTADVDLTLLTGFGGEEPYVDALLARFAARISDAREFALRHRTLLLVASNGVHLDVALGAMPFEERAVEHASAFSIGSGESLTTCSAEDLVVHKAFAGRDKDWLDIRGIVTRQGARLDRARVWAELTPLLELRGDGAEATIARLGGIFG